MPITPITVSALVNKPMAHVWKCWTGVEHIVHWNQASADWHCPHAENDLRVGGRFLYHMTARDATVGFDFIGTYTEVLPQERIAYTIADGRKVEVVFASDGAGTRVMETFEPEAENALELQRSGWQSIMDHFKAYAEAL